MSERVQIPMKPVTAQERFLKPATSATLLRRCACGSSGGGGGECADCRKKKLQRSAAGNAPEFAPSIVHEVLGSPGQSLDSASRNFFESRFGHDFSKVRIHADERASESAQSVNALAYTVGPHIAFAAGQYQPRTASGQRLLTHELTHVVQQQGSSTPPSSLRVGPAADSQEQEAQQTALAVGEEELNPEQHAPESVQRQAASPEPLGSSCATVGNPGASPDPPGSTPTPEHCPAPADMACSPPPGDPVKSPSSNFIFPVNSSDLDEAKPTPGSNYPTVRAEIKAVAEAWKKDRASGKIRIDGFASAEYYCVYNWCLSCRRATAVAGEFTRNNAIDGSNLDVFAHGESDEAGKALAPNRRATISLPARGTGPGPGPAPSPVPTKRDFRIALKSFIAPIGSDIGILPGRCFLSTVPLASPTPEVELAEFAVATDLAFSENPMTDAKDKGYRLFSERTFSVSCSDGRIVSAVPSGLDTDSGKEGPFQAPPLITSDVSAKITGPATFAFSWMAKGRPHLAVEPSFQFVCFRTSRFIWHKVEGEIDCSGMVPPSPRIAGSHFPSHRAFVNGTPVTTIRQGPLSDLWVSSPSDANEVD